MPRLTLSTTFVTVSLMVGICFAQDGNSASFAASASQQGPTFGTTVVNTSGLRGEIVYLQKGAFVLPDFDRLEPVGSVWTSSLNLPPQHWKAGLPGVTSRFEWFAINYSGRFWIEKPGVYRFALLSDDGSKLYLDDELVIDNDCRHPPLMRYGSVELKGGIHRIRVAYFQGPRDCIALVLSVAGPDEEWRVFSTDEFKPPVNPEEWKYGSPDDLRTPPDPDAGRRKLTSMVKHPPKKKAAAANAPPRISQGCFQEDPAPICH